MEINKSSAKYSAIVGIGEKLKKKSIETGQEFLYLNRGINQVVNIDFLLVKNIFVMEINKSSAKYSAIVGIGEKLKKKSIETGQEFLYLNRGINQVVNIDLF